MTRNIALVAINLLIAAVIGANATMALVRGCDFGGRCSGDSGLLTWVLGIGLPLLVGAGAAALVALWLRAQRNSQHDDGSITIPLSHKAAIADGSGDDCSDNEANDVMSARLARMTSAAHVAHSASTHACGSDDHQDIQAVDDAVTGSPSIGWNLAKTDTEPKVDAAPLSEEVSVDASLVLAVQPRPFAAAMERFGDDDDDDGPADEPLGWLIEPDAIVDSPQLRRSSGFPWVVAGIDHVCAGMARLGGLLAGSDFPSEASAWRQVVGNLPRHQPLANEDAAAFTDWLNGMLDMIGPDGLDLIEDALHELAVEAATDPAIGLELPTEIGGPADHDRLSGALRLSK